MLPRVSVIIPIYNEESRIANLIEHLRAQTYPSEKIQLCLVDNNSSDGTNTALRSFGIEPLIEDRIQNADAARNLALQIADGEIYAFTDADCLPDPHWLAAGVEALNKTQADLVAGEIVLQPTTAEPTAGQLYDIATNLRHDRSVSQRRVGFTANLFVRRAVVDDIGGFRPYCGGDHEFTRDAVNAGYQIEYAQLAIVRHPARQTRELMGKAYRIGCEKGMAAAHASRTPTHRLPSRPHFEHLNPLALKRSIQNRFGPVKPAKLGLCYLIGCCYIAMGAVGAIRGKWMPRTSSTPKHVTSS